MAETRLARGRWAAQVFAPNGDSLITMGLILFRGNGRAITLDLSFSASAGTLAPDSSGTEVPVYAGLAVEMRAGRRTYHRVGREAMTFHTLGAVAGFSNPQDGRFDRDYTTLSVRGGFFVEAGALVFVQRRISLGATGRLIATVDKGRWRSDGRERDDWLWQIGARRLSAVVTVYF